jgi:hypothetical protein
MIDIELDEEMEAPVPCPKCGTWVELDSTYASPLTENKLICERCYDEENEVNTLLEEAKDIQYGLDNDDPEFKGDRRGWKKNLKELKAKIKALGYEYDDLV